MLARSFRSIIALGLMLCLSSCIGLPNAGTGRPLVYNIRSVSVMANATLPLDLLSSVDQRVGSAIAATRPPQGAQRVVLLVRIDRLDKGDNARRRMDRARFTVTATSVETGEPVAEGQLVANAPTDDPRYANEALAEEIAARIRYAFSLKTPQVRRLPPQRTLSTRLMDQIAAWPAKPAEAARPDARAPALPTKAPLPPAANGDTPVQAPPPRAAARPPSTVTDGASGAVRLGKGCDATTNPNCLAP
ncbi:hypothetical protein [Rhizobium sp. AAP43]|uniref:hypothetical protein n=1 Tax=Rhizobium sp. AAP43 TaxID=1523420 RepID=UPI0006B9D942|nr:hypothetical protein [Rhizobium sp. AAP43]KPF41759.1 hypothetical protein IP76_19645 [Rhizobium sp. AAP43]